jgi:hypothetical protein
MLIKGQSVTISLSLGISMRHRQYLGGFKLAEIHKSLWKKRQAPEKRILGRGANNTQGIFLAGGERVVRTSERVFHR